MTTAWMDRRLVVVTGKGGVGKSTTAAAIALAAGKAGKRVALCELYGQGVLSSLFGLGPACYRPRQIAPDVSLISLSAAEAVSDFGSRKLHIARLAKLFFESRLMTSFIEAVPGLADLVQLGKIENMLMEPLRSDPVYDLCVLDAPSTGHGVTLLQSANSMAAMTRAGPFYDMARIIEVFLADPDLTAFALVTLPESLPIFESIELMHALLKADIEPGVVIVNQLRERTLHREPSWEVVSAALQRHGATHPDHANNIKKLLEIGHFDDFRVNRQRDLVRDLHSRFPTVPIAVLPRQSAHLITIDDVHTLADAILTPVSVDV